MILKLSKGTARIKIFFTVKGDGDGRRATVMKMDMDWNDGHKTHNLMEAEVCCSKQDQFCRKVGRKLVLMKFLMNPIWSKNFTHRHEKNHNGKARPMEGCYMGGVYFGYPRALTREDRQLLWEAVCPEFKRSKLCSSNG